MTEAKHYRFIKVQYRIALYGGASTRVEGYAIKLPDDLHHIRLCARKMFGQWQIDHYDTGYSFGGPVIRAVPVDKQQLKYLREWQCPRDTRQSVTEWAIRYLRHLRESDDERNHEKYTFFDRERPQP